MIWLLLSVSGLAVETALIITLGRRVTRRYETLGRYQTEDPAAPRQSA